ncbi:HD domain-containing protein [Nibribacter ruber]|uniref:HD domain-containing protein n=1 Tax=Nibribacter ruber TaxID=2698458 RepID=A0A6P1NXJ0_9BACT|nr:HD domain-containing protein [Nibribacter ruber]QHL86381.1 HD domain-containing protein [Nibribacter ruber]
MEETELIQATAQHLEQLFSGEGSGHDWWHIRRVWKTATKIGEQEGADLLVVQLGALLHDIADWKFHDGNEQAGPDAAMAWLASLNAPVSLQQKVVTIVKEVTFKGAGVETKPSTLEGQVVQDADRLDAIGAIGIGRAFAYGGYKGRELYNPGISPELHASFEEYKKNQAPTLNHFYEKLFLLKDRMNTATGKKLAQERHSIMQAYVQQFLAEWHSEEKPPSSFLYV